MRQKQNEDHNGLFANEKQRTPSTVSTRCTSWRIATDARLLVVLAKFVSVEVDQTEHWNEGSKRFFVYNIGARRVLKSMTVASWCRKKWGFLTHARTSCKSWLHVHSIPENMPRYFSRTSWLSFGLMFIGKYFVDNLLPTGTHGRCVSIRYHSTRYYR